MFIDHLAQADMLRPITGIVRCQEGTHVSGNLCPPQQILAACPSQPSQPRLDQLPFDVETHLGQYSITLHMYIIDYFHGRGMYSSL